MAPRRNTARSHKPRTTPCRPPRRSRRHKTRTLPTVTRLHICRPHSPHRHWLDRTNTSLAHNRDTPSAGRLSSGLHCRHRTRWHLFPQSHVQARSFGSLGRLSGPRTHSSLQCCSTMCPGCRTPNCRCRHTPRQRCTHMQYRRSSQTLPLRGCHKSPGGSLLRRTCCSSIASSHRWSTVRQGSRHRRRALQMTSGPQHNGCTQPALRSPCAVRHHTKHSRSHLQTTARRCSQCTRARNLSASRRHRRHIPWLRTHCLPFVHGQHPCMVRTRTQPPSKSGQRGSFHTQHARHLAASQRCTAGSPPSQTCLCAARQHRSRTVSRPPTTARQCSRCNHRAAETAPPPARTPSTRKPRLRPSCPAGTGCTAPRPARPGQPHSPCRLWTSGLRCGRQGTTCSRPRPQSSARSRADKALRRRTPRV